MNIARNVLNGLLLTVLFTSVSGCVSMPGGSIGFSMISPSTDEKIPLQKLSHGSQIEIRKPGEILEGISHRHQLINNEEIGQIGLTRRKYIDYRKNVEVRKYFKDPNELRKTAFAENLIHKLIISSSEFLGTNDTDAAKYAIRILVSYARQNRPMLDQGSRYGHTLGSAAQLYCGRHRSHNLAVIK